MRLPKDGSSKRKNKRQGGRDSASGTISTDTSNSPRAIAAAATLAAVAAGSSSAVQSITTVDLVSQPPGVADAASSTAEMANTQDMRELPLSFSIATPPPVTSDQQAKGPVDPRILEMMTALKKEQDEAMTKHLSNYNLQMNSFFEKSIDSLIKQQDVFQENIGAQLRAINPRMAKAEADAADNKRVLNHLVEQVEKLCNVGVASSSTPTALVSSTIAPSGGDNRAPGTPPSGPHGVQAVDHIEHREIDSSIIKITLHDGASCTQAALKPLKDHLERVFTADMYEFDVADGENNSASKEHALRFTGPESTAARRVGKMLTSLRLGGGKYVELKTVATQASPATRIYCNPDKNQYTLKIEAASRKLKPILAHALGRKVYFEAATRVVSCEWKAICKISFQNNGYILSWAPENSAHYDLKTDEITKQFHEEVAKLVRHSTWV